jgi:hypothetical protein
VIPLVDQSIIRDIKQEEDGSPTMGLKDGAGWTSILAPGPNHPPAYTAMTIINSRWIEIHVSIIAKLMKWEL